MEFRDVFFHIILCIAMPAVMMKGYHRFYLTFSWLVYINIIIAMSESYIASEDLAKPCSERCLDTICDPTDPEICLPYTTVSETPSPTSTYSLNCNGHTSMDHQVSPCTECGQLGNAYGENCQYCAAGFDGSSLNGDVCSPHVLVLVTFRCDMNSWWKHENNVTYILADLLDLKRQERIKKVNTIPTGHISIGTECVYDNFVKFLFYIAPPNEEKEVSVDSFTVKNTITVALKENNDKIGELPVEEIQLKLYEDSSDHDTDHQHYNKLGWIIGVTVSCSLFIIMTGIGVIYFIRRKRFRNEKKGLDCTKSKVVIREQLDDHCKIATMIPELTPSMVTINNSNIISNEMKCNKLQHDISSLYSDLGITNFPYYENVNIFEETDARYENIDGMLMYVKPNTLMYMNIDMPPALPKSRFSPKNIHYKRPCEKLEQRLKKKHENDNVDLKFDSVKSCCNETTSRDNVYHYADYENEENFPFVTSNDAGCERNTDFMSSQSENTYDIGSHISTYVNKIITVEGASTDESNA